MSRPARVLTVLTVAVSVLTGCSGGGTAGPAPSAEPPVATAIAPPQAPGRDGLNGAPPPNVCTLLDAAALSARLGTGVTVRPYGWNDGGVPSLDQCLIVLGAARPVRIGVSVLSAQVRSLDRLVRTLGSDVVQLPRVGDEARLGSTAMAFAVGDRVVRIDATLTAAEAEALAAAVGTALPRLHRSSRESDGACQPAGAVAEEFLGVNAQLRRDSRVHGALTCIWGSADATVSIVESYVAPPGRAVLPPEVRSARRAAIGDEGFYLPAEGRLVFRKGPRIVQVTALADPARPASAEVLTSIVKPVLPLFIR